MNNKNKSEKKIESIENNELLQLVTFNIGDEEFGVDILNIQGINRMVEVTKVPNAQEFVEGIINLRGQVIPIIDLRKRLGMQKKEHDKSTRFIVVEIEKTVVGFIVDNVNEVLRISNNIIEAPPDIVTRVDSKFITAVGKLENRLLILLDLENILTIEMKQEINKISE